VSALPSPKRGPGRPRQYVDDAERAAAHRERVADELATAMMLRTIFRYPTPDLIRELARKYAAAKPDKALAGADFARALLEGLEEGGGGNCADAARNVALEGRSLSQGVRRY
jgi:hypothetical protein